MTTKTKHDHDDEPKPKAADKKHDKEPVETPDDVRKMHQRIESDAGGK